MASTSYAPYVSMREEERTGKRIQFHKKLLEKKVSYFRPFDVCVTGAKETGRRTLIRRFLHMDEGPFQHPEVKEVGPKRDFMVNITERSYITGWGYAYLRTHIFNYEELNLEIIHEAFGNSEAFVVMFDLTRKETLLTALNCLIKITEMLQERTPDFILVGNKIDLHERREISVERGRDIAEIFDAECYYECSAFVNINMDAVFDGVLVMALEQSIPMPD